MLFQKFILTGFINMDYWNVLLIDIYSSILSTWLLFFVFAWAKPLWVPSYMSAAIFQSITDARPFLLGDGSGKPEQPQKAHVNAWTGKPLCSCSFPQSGVLQAMTPLESEWWSRRNSERERYLKILLIPAVWRSPGSRLLSQTWQPLYSCQLIREMLNNWLLVYSYWLSH